MRSDSTGDVEGEFFTLADFCGVVAPGGLFFSNNLRGDCLLGEEEVWLRGEADPGLAVLDRLALSRSFLGGGAFPCPSPTLPESPLSALTAVAMLICCFSSLPLPAPQLSFCAELDSLERGLLLRVRGDLRPTRSNCSKMFLLQEPVDEDTVLSPTAPSSLCEGFFIEARSGEAPVLAGDLPPGLPLDNCFLTMLAMFTSRLWEMSSTCTTALHRKAGLELEVERHTGLAEAQE